MGRPLIIISLLLAIVGAIFGLAHIAEAFVPVLFAAAILLTDIRHTYGHVMGMDYELHQGDCLEILPTLEAGSVDAVITDLPYGTTACKWDEVIPFAPMWEQVKRVLKPRGVFVTTASQPFTSALVMSNAAWFKYEWIWKKSHATGQLNLNIQPMREHENVLVFGAGKITYNLQLTQKSLDKIRKPTRVGPSDCYGSQRDYDRTIPIDMRVPTSVLEFNRGTGNEFGIHPTQKPVALYAYLIRTYTNAGDTVLDFTMGSGTTGVACIKTGRNFIGIEIDPAYFAIAQKRIAEAAMQLPLLDYA